MDNMTHQANPEEQLRAENAELRARLEETEETLRAIRSGEVEALVIETADGPQIFALQGLDAESNRSRGEILAQVSDSVIVVDAEERVTYLNAAAERRYRVSASDVLGRQLSEIYTRHWPHAEAEAAMWAALREHGEWRGEIIHRTHDGREIAVEKGITALRDAFGAPAGYVSVLHDITERKHSAAELQRVSTLLDTLLRTAPIGFCFLDRDLRCMRINERLAEMNGISAEAHVGRHVSEILPTLVETLRDVTGRILATGEAVLNHEFSGETPAAPGVTRFWNESWYPVRDGAGEILGFGGVIEEITARKQAEAALHESQQFISRVLDDGLSAFVGVTTPDGTVTYANRAPLEAAGVPLGEVLGKKFWDCYWWSYSPEIQAQLRDAFERAARGEIVRYDVPVRMAGDTRMWIDFQVAPMRDREGHITHLIPAGIGIEERHTAEEGLRKSKNLVSTINEKLLISTLHQHELRETSEKLNKQLQAEITERKKTEEKLRESERETKRSLDYAEATLRTTPVPFLVLCADLRVNTASEAFYTGFKVKPAETEGRLIYEIGNGQWKIPKLRELLEEIIPKKNVLNGFEVTHGFAGIGTRTMLLNARRMDNADGVPERILLAIEDITERRQSEEVQSRMAAIISSADDGILSKALDGVVTSWNASAERLFGYTAEEIIGNPNLHLTPPELLHEEEDILKQILSGKAVENFETERMMKDGRRLPVSLTVSPIKDAAGKVVGASKIVRDITDRKRAQETLRAIQERFRAAAGAVSDIIWTNNADGSMEGGQHAWGAFTGQLQEDYEGYGWTKAVHPEDAQPTIDAWNLAVAEKRAFEFEHRVQRHDGEWRLCSIRAVPVLDAAGETREWVGVHTDITERKAAEESLRLTAEELVRTARAKDDFLAALSHELRTPLTPVLMTATALADDTALPMEVREQLSMMHRNIELEARLIDDLLDLTTISRGKLILAPVIADLHALLGHTHEIIRSDGQGKKVRIELKLEAERHHALVDPTRIQQVFWNLLKNAIKFTPSGGSISASTTNDADDRMVISFKDNGIGMSAETLPHIFNAFEQGAVAGQHRYGGLGMGLAISQAIVTAHDGAIRGASEGLNCGSTFSVELLTSDAPAASAATTGPAAVPTQTLKLLIVEDHEDTRQVLQRLLTIKGHQVTTVGTAQEALAIYKEERFDAVISDLGLPDGSGLDLMRELQRQRPIPGIALSGYGMEEDLLRTKEAGFFAHLVKPVNLDQLRHLIDQIPLTSP